MTESWARFALPKQAGFLAVAPEGTERRFDVSDVPAGKRAGKGEGEARAVAALKRLDEWGEGRHTSYTAKDILVARGPRSRSAPGRACTSAAWTRPACII